MDGVSQTNAAQCALCGRGITAQGLDPVHLHVRVASVDGSQEVWTHWACLRERLHKSVPLLE